MRKKIVTGIAAIAITVVAGLDLNSALAQSGIDNAALSSPAFREHKRTFGLVYTLPQEVNDTLNATVYGLPLINQPQVAILGVGAIEKRAVVVNDAIAIHPTCHLSLGYDHRLVDGADAGRFLSYIKERLEKFDEAWM